MSADEDSFALATDASRDTKTREKAISELKAANHCDQLSELVQMDDIQAKYREQALAGLAHPDCKPTLKVLVDREGLPESLQEQAAALLHEIADDGRAGP